MGVLDQVGELWCEKQSSIERRIQGWARDLISRRDDVVRARNEFHQWEPLRAYTSISQAKKKGAPSFSLRYRGQDVATLVLKPGRKPYVVVSERMRAANARYFDLRSPHETFAWDSPEGRAFRKHFKTLTDGTQPTGKCREHALESMIIQEMRRKTSAKFNGMLGQVRPVLLYGILPFQVPIPFSAVTGVPKYSDRSGNIDILARRRGADSRVRLSVWELKRPGIIEHAVFQSFIYAATLRYMLRSSSRADWFRLFGFSGALPPSLDVESVVVVSETMRGEYNRQVAELREHNEMMIDQDRIILSVAFYDDETLQLKSFEVVSVPHL